MLSRRSRDGSVPVSNVTVYSLFEKSKRENKNSEIVFLETKQRITLSEIWPKVGGRWVLLFGLYLPISC